ncbi:thiolase family protein [Nocardioides sp. KR10-350]|uniref:thiolase family protein n=1 Tax=Nocardioides cheoyonin TaxID=3156615 RepID=UPI0032B3128D
MTIGAQLRGTTAVVGVGNTVYQPYPGHSADDLGGMALLEALTDAGLTSNDIDGLIVNRVSSYEAIAATYGIQPAWVAQLPTQGRMSGASIQLAALALNAGLCRRVALVYGNNGRTAGATYGASGEGYGTSPGLSIPYGFVSPGAFYALMFRRYMHLYGATSEQLATVSMTFRRHAELNDNAVMRKPFGLDEYLTSRWIVEPLHLLDYCLINDGGVALIMTRADEAADYPHPPAYVLGFGQHGQFIDSEYPPHDFWREATREVGTRSYAMAGITRDDVDALMIYDNFSPNVLFALEGLGYCGEGEAADWIQGGRIALGGQLPINTSGGHLSESYMQGWALNVEAVRQLRGKCGDRQVADAHIVQYVCTSPMVSSVIYGQER